MSKIIKKYKHLQTIEDDINIIFKDKAGLYSFTPYKPDKKGYSIFKIGISSTKLQSRYDAYLTYFPRGVYFNSFLINASNNLNKLSKKDIRVYLQNKEKQIFNYILKNDKKSKRITTQERIKTTEWIFTHPNIIDDAFKNYGDTYLSFLGFNTDFNKEVNKDYNDFKINKKLPVIFTGQIQFY